MRMWLLPSLLLLCAPTALASEGSPEPGAVAIDSDCYIPYPGPDETHGNPFGGNEGFFVAIVPTSREGDQAGSEEYGYGVGMTGCEIDPWDGLLSIKA